VQQQAALLFRLMVEVVAESVGRDVQVLHPCLSVADRDVGVVHRDCLRPAALDLGPHQLHPGLEPFDDGVIVVGFFIGRKDRFVRIPSRHGSPRMVQGWTSRR